MRGGSALVVTLLLLALITIIIVGMLGSISLEMTTARLDFETNKARAMADSGLHVAVAQLRAALDKWDAPYANATNGPMDYYWSVSPGILTRWSYTNVAPLTNYPLFSLDPSGATNTVNLNLPTGNGTYPIAGGAVPPPISVYWVNVLKNPANKNAGATNAIVGRFAFWMDDENAKINLNTADGTLKYTKNSLGLGTPGEVSLQALKQEGAALDAMTASNIVYVARTRGFNSVPEVLRAPGTVDDLYVANTFNLTTCGRSPEINVFGDPKIYFSPASIPPGVSLTAAHQIQYNAITTRRLTEIYPTPYQLHGYNGTNASALPNTITEQNPVFPAVISQMVPWYGGGGNGYNYYWMSQDYNSDDCGYVNDTISRYLGGTNAENFPVRWPVFPYPAQPLASASSSGTNGFMGKFSERQLDAIATAITDTAGKAITPDAISQWGMNIGDATYCYSVTEIHGGYLSGQLVPGMGRFPSLNEVAIQLSTSGLIIGPPSEPPYINMTVYLETYFPAGFGGADLANLNGTAMPGTQGGGMEIGGGYDDLYHSLNIEDMPNSVSIPLLGQQFPRPVTSASPSVIPRMPPQVGAGPTTNWNSDYWSDTMLQNNAGIDFLGNDPTSPDPDQGRASYYHQGVATYTNGVYYGAGTGINNNAAPILQMGWLSQTAAGDQPGLQIWLPGQYRAVVSRNGQTAYPMMTNTPAFANLLQISGGLVVHSEGESVTPLESTVRGNPAVPKAGSWDGEPMNATTLAWANPALAPPGNKPQTSYDGVTLLRDRMLQDVIPVNFTAPVPAPSVSGAGGKVDTWYHAEVADPLVNFFPADWITNSGPGTSMGNNSMGMGSGAPPGMSPNGGPATWETNYYNGQNVSATGPTVNSPYYDPDSFWMPTLDPKLPRSARMPSVGYLNYTRTGVIPDDETVPMSQQHGVPYRCLNFNAVNDASQVGMATPFRSAGYYYPDWAMLDLFTVPSTLLPYHGPYGYYEGNTWMAGAIMTGNPTTMYNFGTWGGSTPGRVNPNGAVIYTTNVSTPAVDANGNLITRTVPLQAVLYGLKINQTIATGTSVATATTDAPTFTGGTTLDATASSNVASAIANYIGTYGPLREPAEICNIPAISTKFPNDTTHYNPTRNDLVRQMVGNLTTQSNVFSVWVAGQSINKSKSNTQYGQYEAGDQILASVRYHYIVERYLDPGADGVVGNSTLPTGGAPSGDVDRIVGTYDDPANANYHPVNPRYLYRVIYAEEIGS